MSGTRYGAVQGNNRFIIKGVLKEDGISIRGVYERSDANERRKEGLPKVKGFIGETFDTEVEITEMACTIWSMW